MLSVLIASYNWNVVSLVKELHQQLEKVTIPFEIICLDDASKSVLNTENEQINSLTNTSFTVLEENIGRSAIRNLLAKKATHDWLLFLDADTMPVSKSFIQNYVDEISKNNAKVVLGGIAYKEDGYSDRIRWKLGKKGEEQLVSIRNKAPYNFFFSGNFLIHKTVFNEIKFDESIRNYGCEDMLFAKELKNRKNNIIHTEAPVFHLGIDKNEEFITKTKSSLTNLSTLIKSEKIAFSDAKISLVYKKSMMFQIPRLLFFMIDFLEKRAVKTSSLFSFNLFRLAYLYKLFNKK